MSRWFYKCKNCGIEVEDEDPYCSDECEEEYLKEHVPYYGPLDDEND